MTEPERIELTKSEAKKKEKHAESVPVYVQALIDSGVPIDHGWAWVICFAAFILHALISGFTRASGLILNELVNEFGRSKAETSVIVTVFAAFSISSAPVGNWLSQKISTRFVIFVGGLSTSFGIGISSFSPNLPVFIVLFSVFSGCGFGFLFTPSIAVVSQYFYRHRSLAVSISMSGSGLGAFVIPPLISSLITRYDLDGMLLILSSIYLHLIAVACLMRPIKSRICKRNLESKSLISDAVVKKSNKLLGFWKMPLLRNPLLYNTSLSMAIMTDGLIMSYMVIPPMGIDIGLRKQQITALLIIMGIPDIIGRLAIGWFADRGLLPRWMIITILGLIQAVMWLGVTFLPNFVTMAIFSGLMGAVGGSISSLLGPVIADAVGIRNINTGLSFTMIFKFITFPVPILLGAIRDANGNWLWSFRMLAIIITISAFLISLTKCFETSKGMHSENQKIDVKANEVEDNAVINTA